MASSSRKDSTKPAVENAAKDADPPPGIKYYTPSIKDALPEKWQSPYPDSRLDEDNDVKDWLREDVVEDSGCSIDALDIRQALDTKFCWARDPHGRPKLTIFNVAYLCSEVFPTARFMEIGHGTAVLITNLRWRKLAGGHICTTIGADAFGTHMIDLRKESCEILHLPQPERTFAWLRLCFKEASMRGVPRTSLWNLYERAFWRSRDTHEYLDKEAFFDCARKAFKGCHEVEVSTNHFIICHLTPSKRDHAPSTVLDWLQRRKCAKLVRNNLMPNPNPQNPFAQHLAKRPLLMLPTSPNGDLPTSPLTARLRRRAANPRQPLGDEEPGFPGVSLKAQQRHHLASVKSSEKKFDESMATLAGKGFSGETIDAAKKMFEESGGAAKHSGKEWQAAAEAVLKKVGKTG